MVKKVKIQKKQKEMKLIQKKLNLSSLILKVKEKMPKKSNDLTNLNTTIQFKINTIPSQKEYFEDEYNKRYLLYLREELNSKVIIMFFNFISTSKAIPISLKNNRYFLKEFLKIMIELLINEIDLVLIALIFDTFGWIHEGEDPWMYIYYICLSAKKKASSDNSFSILLKILGKNNSGFNDSFNKWENNLMNKNRIENINISQTNEKYRDLTKPLYSNQSQHKFINYNEIVNKILLMTKNKEKNTLINPEYNPMNGTLINPEYNPMNGITSFKKENQNYIYGDINMNSLNKNNTPEIYQNSGQKQREQQKNPFNLDLSRPGSRNHSFIFNQFPFQGELLKYILLFLYIDIKQKYN